MHSVLLIIFQKGPSNCKYCIYNTHKHTEGSVEHRDYHNLSQLGVNYIVLCGVKMQCTCKYTYGDRLYLCNICIICIQYIIIQYIKVISLPNGLWYGYNVPRFSISKQTCYILNLSWTTKQSAWIIFAASFDFQNIHN